jgi:hypothetical protein
MNIQTILQQLSDQGWTDHAIGIEVDIPQSIITRIRNGVHKSTSDEKGQRIRALAVRSGIVEAKEFHCDKQNRRKEDRAQ